MIRNIAETLTYEVVGPLSLINLITISLAVASLFFAIRAHRIINILRPRLRERLLEICVVRALERHEADAHAFVTESRSLRGNLSVPEWALAVGTLAARADIDPDVRGDIVDTIFRSTLETQ